MSAFSDSRRDKAIANTVGEPPELMCQAHGCPNRWAVDLGSSRLCNAHYSVIDAPHLWPQVTQQERDVAVMRAMRPQSMPPEPLTRSEKTAILGKLRQTIARMSVPAGGADPKDWTRRLRDRELNHGGMLESGRKLTQAQRTMWREALRHEA